jgi:hypothetical protein
VGELVSKIASVAGKSDLGFSGFPGVSENASITEIGDAGGEIALDAVRSESDFGSWGVGLCISEIKAIKEHSDSGSEASR